MPYNQVPDSRRVVPVFKFKANTQSGEEPKLTVNRPCADLLPVKITPEIHSET